MLPLWRINAAAPDLCDIRLCVVLIVHHFVDFVAGMVVQRRLLVRPESSSL